MRFMMPIVEMIRARGCPAAGVKVSGVKSGDWFGIAEIRSESSGSFYRK
jgi:hypothetical protein